MIRRLNGSRTVFVLDTQNTTYAFCVSESGHLEHLYYGGYIPIERENDCEVLHQKREFEPGNAIVYSSKFKTTVHEDTRLEASAPGHGDIREPFIEAVMPNGRRSLDLLYKDSVLDDCPPDGEGLPRSYSDGGKVEHLCVTLGKGQATLELHYCVYPSCDVITRSARLVNNGGKMRLLRLMSTQLDLPGCGYTVTSFHGAWAREMDKYSTKINRGKFVIESRAGCSSNRANPFFMVHEDNADENSGKAYAFNLVYSGNHYSAVEVNAYGQTRIVNGINPQGFEFTLESGDSFCSPEAVFTYSSDGFAQISNNMHAFVRNHIVRGEWKSKPRPVLLNSWEACYFKLSEPMLLALAKAGKNLGIEMLVMDDGWFGERDSDETSLGDWDVNRKKLPHGLNGLCEKLKELDMQFGIWVEPEMINTQSKLYTQHPNWTMSVPGGLHSEGRNQRVLDLSNPQVVDYLIIKMTEVFSSADIKYVKWDMNRIFSDVYSPCLPPERQGETAHRYILGLYRLMDVLTKRFPHILFEGCASGGNRFDLGILSYFPQIWASDNTDALSRTHIQEGYSYGYPQSCVSCHVSASPNHQTLRKTPLETRFGVASFGILGYECDVRFLSAVQKRKIANQITLYKRWRKVFQYGSFYRVKSGNIHEWICVSQDKKHAVGLLMQELTTPNTQSERFICAGLDPKKTYRFFSIPQRLDIKQFGSLINTLTPIHVKQDSAVHNIISRAVKMRGEAEEARASGALLMQNGVELKQAFSGTGFNENVRVFSDFASRMYFITSE